MRNVLHALLNIAICLTLILPAIEVPEVHAASQAGESTSEGSVFYYVNASGTHQPAGSFDDAVKKASQAGTNLIGLNADYTTASDHIVISNTVEIEMNGNVISRSLSKDVDNGEIFQVSENATLTIFGGTKDEPTAGSRKVHSVQAWVTTSSSAPSHQSMTIYGAAITGGYSSNHGGGIHLEKNATVNLNYVSVIGNRAEQSGGANGYGGGVMFGDKYGKLNMDHASIVYNYAYNDGGGIYVNGGTTTSAEWCAIKMTASHVDYNGCEDNGGGIAVDAENFKLVGDAIQIETIEGFPSEAMFKTNCYNRSSAQEAPFGSTVAYNVVRDSDTDGGGGGIYLWNDLASVNGVNVIGNRALMGGLGGGIFTKEENINISNSNIAYNYAATEKIWFVTYGGQGGGVYVNNDLNTFRNCTIMKNSTVRCGGGMWVNGFVDIRAGGLMIVAGNSASNTGEDNIFLGEAGGQDAHIVVTGLNVGSHIGITLDSSHGQKVACGTSARKSNTNGGATIDQRMFFSDRDQKYMYWNHTTNPWYDASVPVNNSRENIHYNVRWLLALGNDKKPAGYDTNPNVETFVLDTDKGSNLKRVDDYIVEETNYGLYEGVFEYPAFTDSTRDSSGTFFYSDGYFFKDSHTYNEHLATMSFALALAAGYSNKGNDGAADHRYDPDTGPYYPIKTANIIKLLEDIGVRSDDIFINEWNTKAPTTESMGVTIGSKTLPDGKKLVIIGTRGTGYGAEWASNVTLGNEPDSEAAGFSHGADIAFQNLEDYLTAHTINGSDKNTVFWLSGFSRAGAVANLTAKRIIDKYNHDGSRVYAYPMEAPRGGRDSKKKEGSNYSSIHNIINAADVVPYVAPVEMGFVRYGVDHYVPGTAAGEVKTTPHEIKYQTPTGEVILTATEYADNEPSNGDQAQIQEMVKQLRAVNPDVIYDDYFYEATLSFLGNYIYTENISSMIQELSSSSLTAPQFISNLFQDFQSKGFNYTIGNHNGDYRYFYAEEIMRPDTSFQNAAAELCGIFFNLSNSDANALMEVLGNVMYRINLTSVYMDIFRSGDDSWTTYSSYDAIGKGKVDAMADELWNAIATRDEERGFPSIYDVIDKDLADRIHAVWKPLIFPLVYFAHRDYKETDSNVLGSLAYNASRLLMNHNQDVVYSYLRANDGYYKNGDPDNYKRCLISNEIITNIELGIRVTKYQGDTPTTEEHWQSEGNFGIIVLEDERDKVELITKNPDSITSIFYSYEGNPESRTYRYSQAFTYDRIKDDPMAVDIGSGPFVNLSFYAIRGTKYAPAKNVTLRVRVSGGLATHCFVKKSDNTYGYLPSTETMNVDTTKEFNFNNSSIVEIPTRNTELRFVKWACALEETNSPVRELTDLNEIQEYFGSAFNPSSLNTEMTMMKKRNLQIGPAMYEYFGTQAIEYQPTEKSAALSPSYQITFRAADGSASTDSHDRTVQMPVVWTEDSPSEGQSEHSFTATGHISIDDTCTMYSPFSNSSLAPGVWFFHDATPTIDQYVSCELNNDRTVVTFTIRKTISDDQYGNLYKIHITEKDIVTGSTIGTVEVNSAGKIKGIPGFRRLIPELEHWQYAGFDEGTWQNKTIELTAWYRPILDAIEVQVDHAAAAKTSLPRVKKIILKSGTRSWTIDAPTTGKVTHLYRKKGDRDWTENIGNADPDTSYNAKYSLNLSGCAAVDKAGETVNLNDNVALSDTCSLLVKDTNDKEVSFQESILQVPPDSDTSKYLIIEGTYHTGRLSVVSVSPFGPVFFAHGTSSDEVKEYLENARGLVKLSDGSRGNVSFKVSDSIVIPSGMEEQQISITAEIVSSAYDIPDELKQLEIPVIIGQAPSAPVPILNPESTRFGEEGDIEIRHAHPGATIYYAVKAVDVIFDESGKDITPVPDISEFGNYNLYSEKLHFGVESLGKRIFLAVYASEEGFYDSIKDLYTYEVMTNYINLSYVDADGNTQESVTAHRIREDMTELKSEGEQASWFASSGDITLNKRLEINGNVNLILSKGSTLTVNRGIHVPAGSSLTIWTESNLESGALIAGQWLGNEPLADEPLAGIGGNGTSENKTTGSITINGGTITAFGGKDSAAIGTAGSGTAGTITINNGTLDLTGGIHGAGIGGGTDTPAGTITITGGIIKADGRGGAPGIGGSSDQDSISLSWRHEEDSIAASSYSTNGTFTISNGTPYCFEGEDEKADPILIRNSHNRTIVPALWGEATYIWAENYSSVTASRQKLKDSTAIETETADSTYTVVSEPGCETTGTRRYTVVFTNKAFHTQTKTVVLNPLGHDWDEWETTTDASCETAGAKKRVCKRDSSHEQTVVIPAPGHQWGAWECSKEPTGTEPGEWQRTCSNCSQTQTISIPPTHRHDFNSMELHSAVDAKCTTAGNVAYYYCEDCHGYFDADGNPISTIVTPALGHNWSEWATTSPSCTKDGSVERHCTREGCDETISVDIPASGHNWGEWKIVKFPTETEEGLIRRICLNDSSHNQEVPIPKGHHELVKVSRLEPTCEKDGNIEYWYCSICGRIFSDEQGTTEIPFAETILPAVGHHWETTYTWAEDYSSLTGSHTCSVCGKTESETVPTTIEIIKEPTGSEEGEMKVTSAAFQNPDFEPQTITVTLPLYRFTEGMNAVWTKGSKELLLFRVNRSSQDNETARRFTSVLVDDRTVDPGKYETASGSIIIRLKPEYLESLYTGDHSISVTFNDGTAKPVIFTIKGTTPSPEPPVPSDAQGPSGNKPGAVRVVDTSDRTNLALWLTLLLVSSMLSVFSGSCLLKDHYLRKK